MKKPIEIGLSFGVTSGIITTLGLIMGLTQGTGIRSVIIGGIFIIAIADSLSDSLGIVVSEEVDKKNKFIDIRDSALATLLAKFITALTFIVPILFLHLQTAAIIDIVRGLILLTILSYFIAKQKNSNPTRLILEHLVIAIIVIVLTYFVGTFISSKFGS